MQSLDPPTSNGECRGRVGAAGCTADCRQVAVGGGEGKEKGLGLRSAVMTAVLREAGLNQYPDIERVGDTLTIPDPRLSHIRASSTGTGNGDGEYAATDNDVRED